MNVALVEPIVVSVPYRPPKEDLGFLAEPGIVIEKYPLVIDRLLNLMDLSLAQDILLLHTTTNICGRSDLGPSVSCLPLFSDQGERLTGREGPLVQCKPGVWLRVLGSPNESHRGAFRVYLELTGIRR